MNARRTFSAEAVYERLPPILQNVACSLEGLRIQRRRYGDGYDSVASEVAGRARWTNDRLEAFRDERLKAFVARCAANVPHYRQVLTSSGLKPADIQSLADLQRLPLLSKEEVKANLTEFTDPTVPTEEQVSAHTSGTTGGGLMFHTTRAAEREQWAVWWRYRSWLGIRPSTWCGYFGGRSVVPPRQEKPPFWRYNVPARQILFSGYHVSDANLPAYIVELRRWKPPWLHGYPSILSLLGGYLLQTGETLGYTLRWVTTGAESLLPQQADIMTRAFGVRPRQHYGMAEAVANFSGCEQGNLHVDEDFAAVELLPTGADGACRIVGTNLSNPATPLLRYDVHDLAVPLASACPCGRPGRAVSRVDGRIEDFVVLESGARVGRLDHIFKDLIHVREAQIHQAKRGEITIRVVRGTGYAEADEQALLHEVRQRLGEALRVRVDYLAALPRSSTGKLRLVLSELREGSLLGGAGPTPT